MLTDKVYFTARVQKADVQQFELERILAGERAGWRFFLKILAIYSRLAAAARSLDPAADPQRQTIRIGDMDIEVLILSARKQSDERGLA